jgi:hypothetical protein
VLVLTDLIPTEQLNFKQNKFKNMNTSTTLKISFFWICEFVLWIANILKITSNNANNECWTEDIAININNCRDKFQTFSTFTLVRMQLRFWKFVSVHIWFHCNNVNKHKNFIWYLMNFRWKIIHKTTKTSRNENVN